MWTQSEMFRHLDLELEITRVQKYPPNQDTHYCPSLLQKVIVIFVYYALNWFCWVFVFCFYFTYSYTGAFTSDFFSLKINIP